MKKIISAAFLLLVLLPFASVHSQSSNRVSFNTNWKFILDSTADYSATTADDASWRKLNLPHDWSIEGTFNPDNPATTGGGALPGGMGWYRKTFTIPASAKSRT